VGEAMKVCGQVNISLDFEGHAIDLMAVVIDNLVHELIIGTDMMPKNGFVLDMEDSTLLIKETGKKFSIQIAGHENSLVCTVNNVYIPARSERAVWLRTDLKGPIMVEAVERNPAKIMEGVFEPGVDGTFKVVFRNLRRSPVNMTAGSVACKVTRVDVQGHLVGSSDESKSRGDRSVVVSSVKEDVWLPGDEAKIDEANMPRDLVTRYKALINANADVFSRNDFDIGQSQIQHDIKLVDYQPFKARAYRVPAVQTEIIDKHVMQMLEMGVIKSSASPYASPVVLVKKSDNSIRFCVDYRKLNSVTVKDSYPMPLIEERIDSIFGSEVFSGLDLTSGYWQFALTSSATELTAFICHLGLFEFLRMPFGLCNAGATFQRAMEDVLRGLVFAMAYVDDVLVHSKTHEEHLGHLHEVFDRLRKAQLKIKLRKCEFGCRQTKFLGYIVSAEGVKMSDEKVQKVLDFPTPVNARKARSFNGLSGYFSDFVPGYAHLNGPLLDAARLTEKDPVTKKRRPKILAHPDTRRRFRVVTDASGSGLGAVLAQLGDDGVERVVWFAGRALTETERRYTTGERELLAVRWAIKKFRCYLYGAEFDVYTDHKPLTHVKTSKNPSERMLKWILELEEYNITFYYRPGKFNVPADVLSRAYEPDQVLTWYERRKSIAALRAEQDAMLNSLQMASKSDSEEEETVAVVEVVDDDISKAMLTEAQYEDPGIVKMLKKCSEWNGRDGQVFRIDKDDTLYLVDPESRRQRIVLPARYRKHVLQSCHDDLGGSHLGRAKTLHKVAQRFFWVGMSRDVRDYVAACPCCSARKSPTKSRVPPLMSLPTVLNPFDRVAVDFVGPLPKTKHGNQYLLVFVDYATRWPEVFATKDRKASTVAEIFVREILCRHGAPVQLLSDQGKEFLAHVMKETCQYTRTHKIQTAAYHPQTNGLVEKFNGTLTGMLAAYAAANQTNWDELLPMALFGYRLSVQRSTKRVPAELLYARELRMPMDLDLWAPKLSFTKSIKDDIRRGQENVTKVAMKSAARLKKSCSTSVFKVGDWVRVLDEVTPSGLTRKLRSDIWLQPVEVLEVKNNNVKLRNKGAVKWVNQGRIKRAEKPLVLKQ